MMSTDEMLAERLARIAPVQIPDDYARWVIHWIDVLEAHAKTFNAIPLPTEIEPASVFQA